MNIPLSQEAFDGKVFARRLAYLSLPIILQNLLTSSLSFIDTLMIAQVSEAALAAVGLANQMFFLILLFYFGVSSGAGIFIAQYWGARQHDNLRKTMGIALSVALLGALFAGAVSFFFPYAVMRIFSDDPLVIQQGISYLKIVAFSYITHAVVMIYSAALRSTGDSRTPMYTSVVSLLVNIILNYALILGNFGFPRLEVRGAAIATLIARLLEVFLLMLVIYRRGGAIAAPISELFSFSIEEVKAYFKTCLPVILNEMFWSLGMTFYKIAFARLGTQVIASVNVTQAIEHLFFVVLIGISHSAAVMIGNKIGENQISLSQRYAITFLKVSFTVGLIMGSLFFIISPLLVSIFNLTSYVYDLSVLSLRVLSLYLPVKALTMMIVVGILRSGGDTTFSMVVEISGVWFIGVPLAFLGALVFDLPIYAIYALIGLEEIYKSVISLMRIKSGKWIRRLVEPVEALPEADMVLDPDRPSAYIGD